MHLNIFELYTLYCNLYNIRIHSPCAYARTERVVGARYYYC